MESNNFFTFLLWFVVGGVVLLFLANKMISEGKAPSLQKYIDQGISVNTSYNPRFYAEEKIPMSDMLKDIIQFYKYGGKQLYYFNTNDGQGEIDIDKLSAPAIEDVLSDQEDCDSCVI